MREDLRGLAISSPQLKRWSQVKIDALFRPVKTSDPQVWLAQFPVFRRTFWRLAIVDLGYRILFSTAPLATLLKSFMPIASEAWAGFLLVELGLIIVISGLNQGIWIRKSDRFKTLVALIAEVENYNRVVRAVEINDQLEEAGNQEVRLTQREQVIRGLELAKADLVRALKTERILRENQDFIASNSDLFQNNLSALVALQLKEKASEQGRLLDEALQIAIGIQQEMKKLTPQSLDPPTPPTQAE